MPQPDENLRLIRLRYPAMCSGCSIQLSAKTNAWYRSDPKTILCIACGPATERDEPGAAGGSAAREGERRAARRVDHVRREYGDHAAEVAKQVVGAEMDATWGKGSNGESRLAAFIDREVEGHAIAIHDRLIPGSRTNIDLIWVAPTGVWVVDCKAYKGKVVKQQVGPFWRPDHRFRIGGRDRTKLATAVVRQVDAVIAALRPDPEITGVEVHAAICLVESEWDLLASPFQVGNVWVMYPGVLKKRLKKKGPHSRESMDRIARRIALSLPPAA